MKTIFKIFGSDIKTIGRNIIAFIVIIGISILPALYSWFNIASNWDPYSATGGIMFAVCSKDEGYTYKSINVNAGEQIIENLKSNDKMGWDFVDEKEAIDGVDSGKYYAAVVIPKSFSENLCSIITGEFKQSKLDYYVNEKKNAIAPKITNSGMTTIIGEVKSAYVGTVTNIIATTLNLTTNELDSNKNDIIDKVVDNLKSVSDEIDNFNSGIDVFCNTIDTLNQLLKANKELVPKISDTLSGSGTITSDVKNAIDTSRSAASKVTDSIESVISSADDMQDSVSKRVSVVFDRLRTDASGAADELVSITALNQKIISINNHILGILEDIQNTFGLELSSITNKLRDSNTHQQLIIDKLLSAADTLRQTGDLPTEIQQDISNSISTGKTELSSIKTSFSNVKNSINKVIDDLYNTLQNASDLLEIINGDVPKLEKTIDSTITTLDEMKKTFESVKTMMTNSKKSIDELITKASDIKDESKIMEFVKGIIGDPEGLSNFIAEPVDTETHRIHEVENYGSGMSPFYTSLGIWVGGIVLIAIVRTELTKKQLIGLKKTRQSQLFFGRYLIFFLIGQIQAIIISLGDLYFLGIQCNNHFLFVLGCMISAFVYTLIIYSLTITFNVIGKALSVIILVLQVAGSGGTFPVEVLPAPFQSIVPYLPFRYGNDILREAIAGPDISSYWRNVLLLLAFVPVSLIIGLLLRKPCIKLMHFLDKRIHQSDLII